MNDLQRAILDGRTVDVRRIAQAEPAQLLATTWDGTSTLDLARAKGIVFTELALIRLKAPGFDDVTDRDDLLLSYMGQLSQDRAAAGWHGGIEFALWRAVIGGSPLPHDDDPFGYSALDAETVEDLRFLSERAGGWFAWDDRLQHVAFVSRETWVRRYARGE